MTPSHYVRSQLLGPSALTPTLTLCAEAMGFNGLRHFPSSALHGYCGQRGQHRPVIDAHQRSVGGFWRVADSLYQYGAREHTASAVQHSYGASGCAAERVPEKEDARWSVLQRGRAFPGNARQGQV